MDAALMGREMMRVLLQPLFYLVFAMFVRASDLAISAAIARSVMRAICYGIVAVIGLLIVVLTLFGV
jgi:hypothetical protein